MGKPRVIYYNYIAERGSGPDRGKPENGGIVKADDPAGWGYYRRTELIRSEVNRAIARLNENEREFIRCFYYMGQTYAEIAGRSGRAIYRLEAMHRRALRRLRKLLQPLAYELWGIEPEEEAACVICSSPMRAEIDRLIETRDRTRNWKPVLEQVRVQFGIRVKRPQDLIVHERYHLGPIRRNRRGR